MPGVQLFTHFQTGKETVAGTAVAATREWYPDGTGIIDVDNQMVLHGGNRGTRANVAHASTKGDIVSINYRSNPDMGAAFDELPYVFGQLDGGNTGAGGAADKTWTIAPSMTGANAQESYTIEAGDDTQNFEFEYCQARSFTLSAARDTMTDLEVNWYGRQPTKSAVTAVAANTAVKIPGYLWKIRFATAQSGLAAASDQTNFLLDWQAEHQTGLTPRFYLDGTTYFGQSVESLPQKADLTLHVESTSTAISQFYDKWRAQTVDFIQLKAVGPTLGGSNYSAQLQYAVLYTMVRPISAESDGVNIYEVTATSVYDSSWANYFGASLVASIAALT